MALRKLSINFQLLDIFSFSASVIGCVGIAAGIEYHAINQFGKWWGDYPSHLEPLLSPLIEHASLTALHLPVWLCYSLVAFFCGSLLGRIGGTLGIGFVVGIFTWNCLSIYFRGLGLTDPEAMIFQYLSCFAVLLSAASLSAGKNFRQCLYEPDIRANRFWKGIAVCFVVALLGLSVVGWEHVAHAREGRISNTDVPVTPDV